MSYRADGPGEIPVEKSKASKASLVSPANILRQAKQGVSKATAAVKRGGQNRFNPLNRAATQAKANTRKQLESQSVRPLMDCGVYHAA